MAVRKDRAVGWLVRTDGGRRRAQAGGRRRPRPKQHSSLGLSCLMAAPSTVGLPWQGSCGHCPEARAGPGRTPGRSAGHAPTCLVDRGHSRPSSHRWPETLVLFSSFCPQGSRVGVCFPRGQKGRLRSQGCTSPAPGHAGGGWRLGWNRPPGQWRPRTPAQDPPRASGGIEHEDRAPGVAEAEAGQRERRRRAPTHFRGQ